MRCGLPWAVVLAGSQVVGVGGRSSCCDVALGWQGWGPGGGSLCGQWWHYQSHTEWCLPEFSAVDEEPATRCHPVISHRCSMVGWKAGR
jgi:hypothetical protein